MLDILVKNLHIFFFLYAGYIAMEHQEVMSDSLQKSQTLLQTNKNKLKKAEKALVNVKKFQDDLENSKRKVEDVVAKINEMQKQLPSDIKDTLVTGKLSDFGNELKMVRPSAAPKQEINNGFYFSKEYKFDAKGTYLQALVFFEKLENLSKTDRILNVKYVNLRESKDADPRSRFKILDITATIEAYRYNANYDPKKEEVTK